MGKDSINEMEQIHKGLEEFLENELGNTKAATQQQLVNDDLNFTAGKDRPLDVILPQGNDSQIRQKSIRPQQIGNQRNYAKPNRQEVNWKEPTHNEIAHNKPSRQSGTRKEPTLKEITLIAPVQRDRRKADRKPPIQRETDWEAPIRREAGRKTPIQRETDQTPPIQRDVDLLPLIQRDTDQNPTQRKKANRKKPSRKEVAQKDDIRNEEISSKKRLSEQEKEVRVMNREKRNKKKKSKIKRFFLIVLFLILLIGGLWYYLIGIFHGKMNYGEIQALTKNPMKEEGVVNILFIGTDSRTQDYDGRSDAMILLSISDATKTVFMTSLLRDMYVEIPGRGGNRLNAAYSYGGAELLMETIKHNFDIDVNRHVTMNFQAFANIVDAMGGVELELTNEEVIYVNGFLVEYNILMGNAEGTNYLDESLSGMIPLNGPQALAYSRNRLLGGDFARTERQRKVLSEVIRKAPRTLLTNPTEMMDGLLPNMFTNLTQNEFYWLSMMLGKLATYNLIQSSIPLEGTYKNANINGMAVLEVDLEANKKYIRTEIYGD